MKVTDGLADHEGNGSLTCDPGTATWPYDTTELDRVYATSTSGLPDYAQGIWSLDSANDALLTMAEHNMNLYLASVNGGAEHLPWSSQEANCYWHSLAAIDDVVQYCLDNPTDGDCSAYDEAYTGIVLAPGTIDTKWPCDSWGFIKRARLEHNDHSDVLQVVAYDELWRLIDGPDTSIFQSFDKATDSWKAHWTPVNVDALYTAAHASSVSRSEDINSTEDTSCSSSFTMPANGRSSCGPG